MILNKLPKIGHGGIILTVLAIAFLMAFLMTFLVLEKSKNYDLAILEISDLEEPEAPVTLHDFQDSVLMKSINTYLNRYKPPNAFILIMDAQSGNILAWGQREDDITSEVPTFLQRDSFPAASLAKIITAVAVLEHGKTAKSQFPKIGRNSTLYKRQIFPNKNYKGTTITLEEAFARSNNPAMGIMGIELGADKMQNIADKLGFTNINYPDSAYYLAESSSGFTKRNMISPLQTAHAIRNLIFTKPSEDFKKRTYEEIRTLFLKTVTNGTARRHINKTVYNHNKKSLDIGGKTGSLDGEYPSGRYDWFAGFAQSKSNPEKGMVIVVMQVHGKKRNQYSSIIAGLLINDWAKR